jgi:uncharacterized membrane protein
MMRCGCDRIAGRRHRDGRAAIFQIPLRGGLPVQKRLPLVFRHITYNLRGGFLLRPLAIALGLGLTGAAFSWLEQLYPILGNWIPSLLFPSRADPVVAQVILSDIATSIMTVVSIVFAILLMTLTLASMQFSPRILVSFSRDRATQSTLGVFLGTFCYCMAALPAARSVPRPFAPVATVMGAMILAVACVGWLLYFIHHISHAISVNFIVDRIAAETEVVIDDTMPTPRREKPAEAPGTVSSIVWDAAIINDYSGYIRFIDTNRLFELAKTYRVKARVLRRVGHFVPAGVPLMNIARGDRLPDAAGDEFRKAFDIGPSRTLQQDVEFGVLQIVDIALRAISPAVNDPSTAINGIDQLSRILIRFASRQEPVSVIYDLPGEVRLIVPWIDFQGLLDSAFEQIRHYGATDVTVCLRLLRALGDIAISTSDHEVRSLIAMRGKRVVAGCAREKMEGQMKVMEARLRALEELATTGDQRPA